MRGRWARAVVGAALVAGAMAVLRPWTVRPIERSQPAAFDAAAYVAKAWPRLITDAERTAIDVTAAVPAATATAGGAPPPRRPVFLRVTGLVTDIDRHSRVGVAYLRSPSGASARRVAIQVGPVIRGTALRDAAGFIRFSDFANQTDFAAVANGLNERVLAEVLGRTDVDAWAGRTITVIGAGVPVDPSGGAAVELVPLSVRVERGGR